MTAVHAGNDGEDAQAFAEMLTEMYRAYQAAGGQADLGGERGVHRLVRISPFDPLHRRQTTFAHVGDGDEGRVVRSYVLDPYQLAKNGDGRTVDDVYAVLSGERLAELL